MKSIRKTFLYDGPLASASKSAPDAKNRILAEYSVDELLKELVGSISLDECLTEDFYFYGGGWQSWGFGGELEPGKYEKKYVPLVPQFKRYIEFPGRAPKKVLGKNPRSKKLLNGYFVIYLRWQNTYLCLASVANENAEGNAFPPVKFYVDRKSRRIAVTAYSDGKKWAPGEKMGELEIFSCGGYFELKDHIGDVFSVTKEKRFTPLKFLSSSKTKIECAGWESWYNHYANIDSKLIAEDLDALGKTENIIKTFCMDKNKPTVFQVDDGWEKALGQWESRDDRFPQGMKKLAESIAEKNYIPGLWVAPLIIDLRCDFAQEHKDWILCDKKGKPVPAGMNFLWGAVCGKFQPGPMYSYFTFDLSIDAVVEYLDSLMDSVINEWGFRYLKLDFLFAGLINGNFKNGGSAYQWYDRAVKVLTKRKVNNKGEPVAYLGCGAPFESSYNCFPLSRIGSDTKEAWDDPLMSRFNFSGRPGALLNMQSTLGHSFWNQSVFVNDPDVIFMRYKNIQLTDTEKELIAVVNKLFASQFMHSDDPSSFDVVNELAFTKKIMALYEKYADFEFGLVNESSCTYRIFTRDGSVTGYINLGESVWNVDEKNIAPHSIYINEC